ncbi:MAG: glycine cleavage system aminomethyltransferase GcvT, partial [Acidobacteriota bacterium]
MSDRQDLRRTPLFELHREAGARLVPFAGWEMPLQYSGVVEEHLAVRSRAGLFDVSHMGQVEVTGDGGQALLQGLTPNDVSRLAPGQAQYSALLNEKAGMLDDIIIYCRAGGEYMVVVNAANAAADHEWVARRAPAGVSVRDRSREFALLALQGPEAEGILEPVAGKVARDLAFFGCAEASLAGAACMVGRTGYTGEDGYEILVPAGRAEAVWRALMEAGARHGLVPVGLAARDTLRLEAGLILHGTDATAETTPLEAGVGFIVRLDAGPFIGRETLVRQREQGVARRLRGIEMVDRGIARGGHAVLVEGEAVGVVTSGSFAPFLKKNIARAWLPAA